MYRVKTRWIGGMIAVTITVAVTWLLYGNIFLILKNHETTISQPLHSMDSAAVIPYVVKKFLTAMTRVQNLIVIDKAWLNCLAKGSVACKNMSSKRDFVLATKRSLSEISVVGTMFTSWSISTTAQRIVFKRNCIRIFLIEIVDRMTYWYTAGIPEVGRPAMAFLSFDVSPKNNCLFGASYPLHLDSFLSAMSKAEFLECKKTLAKHIRLTHPKLYHKGSILPKSIVADMVYLRNLMSQYNSTLILFGGILLGWYRECGLISHTTDVDFAVFATEFAWTFVKRLEIDKQLHLYWHLGRVNDSFELSVYTKHHQKIDIFYLYEDANKSWVGGLIPSSKTALRWIYPKVTRLCTAELLRELFHVPCNVEDILKADYGNAWYKIHHTNSFVWYSSHNNVQQLKVYNLSEWPQVYHPYRS